MKTTDKGIKKFSKEEKLAIYWMKESGMGLRSLYRSIAYFRRRIIIGERNSTFMQKKV
jgi:hypothetical protein